MKATITYRRWGYMNYRGMALVVTKEYTRMMKKFKTFKKFKHRIVCEKPGAWNRSGDVYDVIDIEV